MNGFTIATQSRRTPPRTQPPVPRRPAARPRPKVTPPYRPNYWLVVAGVIVVALLAVAFLVTIAILWTLTGPLMTAVMVLIYAAAMYALWRVGISRL